ncbi:MAG TPA: ATP-binding cassette domain-containing protein [Thermoleophilaceae bacterium]|nr:ATP-binding cassette domain-containing protein [Thermoleophilaceae bacterium]
MSGALLEMRGITLDYPRGLRRAPFRALDEVDLEIGHGETVGLVGESGSGKTSLGRIALGLQAPTAGSVHFDGEDVTRADRRRRRALARDLQAVFQDPYSSLNPTRRIGSSVAEPLLQRRGAMTRAEIDARVAEMLRLVGLDADAGSRYPRQFSGGQRQRIAIARALIVSPKLVVCDEPVSALDLSVQAQVLNLLAELQETLGLSYLFIAHDLSVVRFLCRRVVVLRAGRLVECGSVEDVFRAPRHAYTRELLAAIPRPNPDRYVSVREGGPVTVTKGGTS